MVSNDEIEADLTSIFSRLRNSEQYWIKPRNDLNCIMDLPHGSVRLAPVNGHGMKWVIICVKLIFL